jgi:hypothetical protein
MPRNWSDDARGRERWEEARERRGAPAEDFGQADYSGDYAYDSERRSGYRVDRDTSRGGVDYGQADYSLDYAYDAERGRGYRRFTPDDQAYGRDREVEDERRRTAEGRSWRDRAGAFFAGREGAPPRRRHGPSDRVLWAIIVERLEDERGLDLRDVAVNVEDAEVTLDGVVRHKADKRRIEDVVDIDGVRHVQNNLRVRHGRWF